MNRIGTYEIQGELGRGAMGVVYKAVDTMIGRTVAIKTIVFQAGSDPNAIAELRQRLFREAQSAGRLTHPGIVTIYQLGEESGVTFIAMEFVEGPTLEHLVSAGRLDIQASLRLVRQIAVALDYAHSKGVVHRDIKPANIMVTPEGATKIADFGIAKALGSTTLTQTGASLGTPFYMSPEQVQARMLDGRSDQFSLAVIAYRMLTGEKSFQAETMTGLIYKILHEQPPAPHHLNPEPRTGRGACVPQGAGESRLRPISELLGIRLSTRERLQRDRARELRAAAATGHAASACGTKSGLGSDGGDSRCRVGCRSVVAHTAGNADSTAAADSSHS